MDRRWIAAIVLVLIVAVAGWFYSDYRSAPEAQAPVATSTNPGATPPAGQGNIIEGLKTNWAAIAVKLPVQPMESKRWYIDAARTVSPSTAMVAFEDGLNGYTAVVTRIGSDYRIDKFYENQMKFTAAELAGIHKEFGDPGYVPVDYERSEGNGELNETTVNMFLQQPGKMQIKVALLNTDGTLPDQTKPGDISGCDHVILVERTVDASPGTLRSALDRLLAPGEWQDEQLAWGKLYNYANRGTLKVDSVSIVNGTAKVYLTGTPPTLGGVCDDPRLFVQVAQTARQFSTVQKVELYVNGTRNNGSSDLKGE